MHSLFHSYKSNVLRLYIKKLIIKPKCYLFCNLNKQINIQSSTINQEKNINSSNEFNLNIQNVNLSQKNVPINTKNAINNLINNSENNSSNNNANDFQ